MTRMVRVQDLLTSRSVRRGAVIVGCYLCLYLLLDFASLVFRTDPVVSIWYAADAASLYVTFSFEGPGTNPAPAAGYFDSHFQLIADGNSVPIDIQSSGGDMEAPPRTLPCWSMSFQAPEDARSLVLQVTPMLAGAHTVAFRLW